jgi:hypothetical protein
MEYNGKALWRIAGQSKQTVRGGPKLAKVGLHRRLIFCGTVSKENCILINKEMQECERNKIVYRGTLKWERDRVVRYG